MDAQGKRQDVWMPRLGTSIASTAHTPTLRARCVLHSLNIPFIPPTNAAVTTLGF